MLYKKNFKEKIIRTEGNLDRCNNMPINSVYSQDVDWNFKNKKEK
ncbi:hypothetical protein [Clostridium sp. Marseille-Q7071]